MITVFTPTYNRAHLLPNLYQSLLQQKTEDFEWLVVDDGSTDGTEELVNQWIEEAVFTIRYFKKENGGKHTAINKGVQLAEGDLFFIIDSDDVLAEDALHKIKHYGEQIKKKEEICGIIGLSQYLGQEKLVGDCFLYNEWEVSFADVYLKYHLKGDKSVAFKTEVLKQYPFPEEQEVRFVFEAVVWHEMSKKYKVLAINEVIQKKEYLQDGLTDSSYKKWYVNALAFSYFQLIKNRTYPFAQYPSHALWNYIHLGINALLSGKTYFKKLSLLDQLIYVAVYPRAFYSYLKLKDRLHD